MLGSGLATRAAVGAGSGDADAALSDPREGHGARRLEKIAYSARSQVWHRLARPVPEPSPRRQEQMPLPPLVRGSRRRRQMRRIKEGHLAAG